MPTIRPSWSVALLAEGVDRNHILILEVGQDLVALLAEGVDRNKFQSVRPAGKPASPSSRRAWIEIKRRCTKTARRIVALLAEGVDRNLLCLSYRRSVDRVALLAEGVDRNAAARCQLRGKCRSPSSRRAWIEINRRVCVVCGKTVALLAEGVDRNVLISRLLPG